MRTVCPSRVSRTSNSTPSPPGSEPSRMAASVFSGASKEAPRWAMICIVASFSPRLYVAQVFRLPGLEPHVLIVPGTPAAAFGRVSEAVQHAADQVAQLEGRLVIRPHFLMEE